MKSILIGQVSAVKQKHSKMQEKRIKLLQCKMLMIFLKEC